jgi:DNA-binding MarR family transcriptional regulator
MREIACEHEALAERLEASDQEHASSTELEASLRAQHCAVEWEAAAVQTAAGPRSSVAGVDCRECNNADLTTAQPRSVISKEEPWPARESGDLHTPDQLVDGLRMALIRVIRRHEELTVRQLGMLMLAGSLPPQDCTVRAISANLGIARPIASKMLDRLCVLRLAVRRADPRDRRSVLVAQTAAGRKLCAEFGAPGANGKVALDHTSTTQGDG